MWNPLFARPSFLSGVGRVLDIGGVFDSYGESEDADWAAMGQDFCAVGTDIRSALDQVSAEVRADRQTAPGGAPHAL